MNDYYTYRLRYPSNYPVRTLADVVFYVGKGRGNRINGHVQQAHIPGTIQFQVCGVERDEALHETKYTFNVVVTPETMKIVEEN